MHRRPGFIHVRLPETDAGAEIGAHRSLRVRRDQDQAARGGRPAGQRRGRKMHAEAPMSWRNTAPERVVRHLAEIGHAGAQRRRHRAGVGGRSAAAFLPRRHRPRTAPRPSPHRSASCPFAHVVARQERVVGARHHIDDGVADPEISNRAIVQRRAAGGTSSPTPRKCPNSSASRARSAGGSGGFRIESILARRCATSPVPNSTTSTPGSWRTKRYAASVRLEAPPGCTRNPSGSVPAKPCRHLAGTPPARASSAASCTGRAKMLAHREHQQRADLDAPASAGNTAPGVLAHHVERHHDHVPKPRAPRRQSSVLQVVRRGLGDAEEAELPLLSLRQQRRHDHVAHIRIARGGTAWKLEHVDAVDARAAAANCPGFDHLRRRDAFAAAAAPSLWWRSPPDRAAAGDRLAHHRLGAVGRRGVDRFTPRSSAAATSPTACASVLPVASPSRLNPPAPNPATLTRRPVRPRMVYPCCEFLRDPRPVGDKAISCCMNFRRSVLAAGCCS